jgi:hypothetical protein
LALACEPSGAFDREAYAAKVAMLTDDCADLPDDLLEAACNEWRTTKPFLPRAAELREAVKSMLVKPDFTGRTWADRCNEANAAKDAKVDGRRDIRWAVEGLGEGTGMRLEYVK